jgi:outer membrane protein assembly complex protein YaeT
MRYRYWIIFVVALILGSPVYGQKDVWQYGRNFKGWEINSIQITGVEKSLASDLKKGLSLAGKEAVLYEQELLKDIDRVVLYLAKRGYPYATVDIDVERAGESRKVDLTLLIDTGPAVAVRSTTVTGMPAGLFDRSLKTPPYRDGDVFVESDLFDYKNEILEVLNDAGYARADVTTVLDWPDTVNVNVTIAATPGAVYYFRRIAVTGVKQDLIDLAYTMVDIHPGDRFHPRLIRDARDYLSKLGLFRQIRLDITDIEPDSLDLDVVLSDRKPKSIEVGGGWWSDEGLSGRLAWRHRNLLRRGRGVSIEFVGTQYRRYSEAMLWWPAPFGAKRSMWTIRLGINNENEASYEKTAPGIGTTFSYLFTRISGGTIGYFLERASYDVKTTENILFNDTEGVVAWFEGRLSRDGTDDRVRPSRGSFSWLRLQWGPDGGVSSSSWLLSEISGTYHVPLRKRMLLAVNARAGAGKPTGIAQVLLPDKRFYAGGSMSHRGFARRELGPKDINGLPLGGEIMATGFVELRFPFVWKIEGAVFTDWGQVWQAVDDVNMRNMEIAIGPALRLNTPVGPFRLDWGWRVTNYDTTVSRWALHFAIGYPM